MKLSRKDFLIFYQNPTSELGAEEYVSFSGGFFTEENYIPEKGWGRNILEAAWRLSKSGIAIIDYPASIKNIFTHLSSCSKDALNHDWGFCLLDPTQFAVNLKEKYKLHQNEPFNPEFFKELCRIFDQKGVGFNVPCPYVPNWKDQDIKEYPWSEL